MILSIIFLVLSIYLILIMYKIYRPAYKWVFRVIKNRFKKKLDNVFNKQ